MGYHGTRPLLRLHLRETGGCIFVSARGHVVPATWCHAMWTLRKEKVKEGLGRLGRLGKSWQLRFQEVKVNKTTLQECFKQRAQYGD